MKKSKRVQSVKFRKVQKNRNLNGLDVNRYLRVHNPWSTIYKENFGQSTRHKKTINSSRKSVLDDVLSVKSLNKRLNVKDSMRKSNLKYPGKVNNFFARNTKPKTNKNNLKKQSLKKTIPKMPKIETIKNSLKKNESEIEQPKSLEQSRLDKSMALVNNYNRNELKGTKFQQRDKLGQEETWVNPLDAVKNPVHSRVVTDPKKSQFIETNLKNFLSCKNEYYPYIGGKCLCGQCTCGQCKCVHFKYKTRNPKNRELKTMYNLDFVPWDCEKPKLQKQKPELINFPFPKDFSTQYNTHYKRPDNKNKHQPFFRNMAKFDNINALRNKIKAPCAKETHYQLDYPNWEANKPKAFKPFVPNTRMEKLPFFDKTANNAYGDFYKNKNYPKTKIVPNPTYENRENPLGPNIPINYKTSAQDNFIKFPEETIEPVERRIPKDNIFINKHPFENQFKTIQKDFDFKNNPIECPIRKGIKRVKNKLRDFARKQRIPY